MHESHHLKQIFYHQNIIMIFCWFCMFPFYVFLHWILFSLCPIIFLLNKVCLNSLNSVAIFTPFAVLDYLSAIVFTECIFIFNSTKSTFFPFKHFFHFTNNFFIGRIKKNWIFKIVTEITQVFVLQKFFINIFWFYFISMTVCASKSQFSIKILFNKVAMEVIN